MTTKHIIGGAAAIGAGAYALHNGAAEIVGNIASAGAGATAGIAELTNNAVSGVLESASVAPGIAEAFLPTLATGVAGEYGMRKVADILKIENNTLRNAMRVTGAVGGAVAGATASAAMPYILLGAGLIAAKDIPMYALGKAGQGVGALWGATGGFVWGGAKGAVKGGYNALTSGWSDPKLKPQVGF